MTAEKGTPAALSGDHHDNPINSSQTNSSELDTQNSPLETPKHTKNSETVLNQAAPPKPNSTVKSKAQATALQPAAPMGTSSLIGSIKTVRPKKQNIEKAMKKAGPKVPGDRKPVDNVEKAHPIHPEPETLSATGVTTQSHIKSSHSASEHSSPSLGSALLPTHLLSSPPSNNNFKDTFETSSEIASPIEKRLDESDLNTTPSTFGINATPGSQSRSLRRSSRRTATSSVRLEKARKLFQDAGENASPITASKGQADSETPVKDFALDYDSGAEPVKESRSQLLAKQRKGQVLGNSQLELHAHSSLPLIPSFMPTSNTGPARQNSTDSQAPTPTQANWNHGLSPGSPPFFPSRDTETQSLGRISSSLSTFDGLPSSYGNNDRFGQGKTIHSVGTGSIDGKGSQGSFGRGSTGMQSFGILSGSQQETRTNATGKVRSWTLSQLGKGKPSIPPSDRQVKREPSILELVHAGMESTDGTILNRPARRTTTSPGVLHYVDPQRRLRSNTLTSIPATGKSDDDIPKPSQPKEARHGRSHTSADPRGIQQQRQQPHASSFQPESVTTSSDVEDHFADSEGESIAPTMSQNDKGFVFHSRHGPIDTDSENETEHGGVQSPDQDANAKSRMLTGISPAMRGDFQGRVLQFGPGEDEYQPLKTRMHSAASSINSIAGTHGSVMSPAPVPAPAPKKTAIISANDTKICDTCGKPTATSVLTLMEPCCHLACFDCLNAVLNTVCSNGPGGNPGRSRCSAFECSKEIVGIVPYLLAAEPVREQVNKMEDRETKLLLAVDALPYENEETVVVRMDNVAWDVTPEAVMAFLPPHTLADDLIQNVHIMLDRNDGKAKDYLFFECRDRHAATQVLRTKQNAVLGSPPRARPVTLTLSTHAALITELRPSSPQELENLMLLCRSIDNQAASTVVEHPTGLQTPQQTPRRSASDSITAASPAQSGRFLKSPLAPFHSVLSLLSKIATKDQTGSVNSKASVIYWDLFACAAGAIAVLAKRIIAARRMQLPPSPPMSQLDLVNQASPPQNNNKMIPGSPKASFSRPRSNSQTAQASIDAKIRDKLEKDRARQTSGSAGPLATPRAQGRARLEQPATPSANFKPLESFHSREQEEALAHLMIAAFEKTFGVRIDQRDATADVQA